MQYADASTTYGPGATSDALERMRFIQHWHHEINTRMYPPETLEALRASRLRQAFEAMSKQEK